MSTSPFVLAGRNDLYGDAFNEAVFMRPGQRLTDGLVRLLDSGIDGTVNGTATAIGGLSGRLRRFQNGFVRSYALTMTAGAAVIGAVILAAAFAAFVVQNTDDVGVKWLFFEPELPLWMLLIVTSAIAIVAAELIGWAIRRRRNER